MPQHALTCPLLLCLGLSALSAGLSADERTMSFNDSIQVVPAPGPVVIDGKIGDWDLSAGVWSYNDPTVVERFSVWTHLMWDDKGVYLLARYSDLTPMKNAAAGKDFDVSWRADCYQARVIFDDRTPDEHQMHVNMYFSSTDNAPYMIVHHGGLKTKPPYDETGEPRPDLLAKLGPTMAAAGGSIAFAPWSDGCGYDMECFWPWSYCRASGKPLAAGEQFTYGIEGLWGNHDGSSSSHRLADGIKDESVNRIFMFRARKGWGKAVISASGKLSISDDQRALQRERLKRFQDYDTYGSVPITYTVPAKSDVTIAIDDAQGRRVRNLFGQYPRDTGSVTDKWDAVDDQGNPVPPGEYTATILHHQPIALKLFNSVYSSATPPWPTEKGTLLWGSNHGHPTSVATRGDVTVLFFTGTEGGSGIQRINDQGIIQWSDGQEFLAGAIDEKFVYGLSRSAWQRKTLIFRYELKTGQLTPFTDAARSPSALLFGDADVADGSLALAHGVLWALFPGRGLLCVDSESGAITRTLPSGDLVGIAEAGGKLYVLAKNGALSVVDAMGTVGAPVATIAGLTEPKRLAVDATGERILISDHGSNQVVLCDRTGKELRRFGHAYAGNDRPAGPFVVTDLIHPMGTGFDHLGRIWIPEGVKNCKRVGLWDADGKLLDQFWGQADYGATSGWPITHDSTRFIAHGIEFRLDPQPDPWKRKTAEQPLIFHPELDHDRGLVWRVDGRDYACGAPGFNKSKGLTIFRRNEQQTFVPCVRLTAGGKVSGGKGKPDVVTSAIAWVDCNGDGAQDADEITSFTYQPSYWSNGWVRPDLALMTPNGQVFKITGFGPAGVPLYDFSKPEQIANWPTLPKNQTLAGTPIIDAAGNVSNGISYATIDGRSGSYPNPYGRHDAPAARRGLLIAPFRTNGVVEGVPGLGSITALGGDRGEWFLMSMDGLFVSSLCQDIKGLVTLDETFIGSESFGGFLWRDTTSGKVLVQLGGASYRLMEVIGLDTCVSEKRKLTVTDELVKQGVAIAQERSRQQSVEPQRLRIANVRNAPKEPLPVMLPLSKPLIDGGVDVRVAQEGDPATWWRASLAIEGQELVAAWQVADPSPWRNGEGQFTHAFIGGDAVDLQLDVPGRGPVRILIAKVGGKDTAVYWQLTAEGATSPITYSVANNPSNATTIAVVKRLDEAIIATATGINSYTVLLRIPLKAIGLDAARGAELKGLVGVIFSNPAGDNRASRLYWHDKATGLVSDVPSEARIDPKRWGPIDVDR
ncbi:MAG TPA: FlgD immunoglobulin-like domain containing protein [Planctomycetota bacterium]|nr:FlgD immunoglobulin-like domain containing protein [Planctomycetota bacterium]